MICSSKEKKERTTEKMLRINRYKGKRKRGNVQKQGKIERENRENIAKKLLKMENKRKENCMA